MPAGIAAYDVAIVHAFVLGSGTAPTLPSGWTDVGTIAATSYCAQRVGYKVLTGAETTVGIWTGATSIQVCVYRGMDWTTVIGVKATGAATAGTLDTPNLSLSHTDGTSWVVTFAGIAGDTSMYAGALAGHTNRSSGNGAGSYIGAWDMANPTSYTDTTYYPSGGSYRIIAHAVELWVATAAPPETPYVWSVVAGALPTGIVLDSATGELSAAEGEITAADGTYIFSIQATNNTFATQVWTCQITVYGTGLGAATWSIDMEKLVSLRTLAWHRHSRTISRPVIVEGKHVLYATPAKIVYRLDRATVVSSGAYWVSPTLNRTKRQCDYTLVEVLFRYKADDTTIIKVYGSGNGGQTWKDAIMTFTPLFGADQSIRWIRTHFNVTGSDVRFKVEFSGAIPVHLFEWQAQLVERESRRKG
jgi:hypothetical protein